jgi:glycosyltransferase involved in cell wall biosynthesis
VSADRPHKNLGLAQGLAREWHGSEKWVFTVAGTDTEGLRYLGPVEDTWLRPLYSAATALIAPSRYEGFSLPPIEALSAGAIAVVSDIPPHRESLGDVLPPELFFDPASPGALEKSLSAVIHGGEPLRASILEKFRLVRDRYSVVETARLVEASYREALRG